VKPASPRARIVAFWLDALIVVTVLLGLARVIWTFMPGTAVRESAMQLYTVKEFRAFFANGAAAILFLWGYFRKLPAADAHGTFGQRLARIRVARPDGSPLTPEQHDARARVAVLKAVAVLFGGPVFALLGGNLGLSIAGLVAPLVALLVLSALAWSDPHGAGPLERAGNYRYFSVD
jgi:hypothetical protein